jgi:Chlorophyll A-B binding protein
VVRLACWCCCDESLGLALFCFYYSALWHYLTASIRFYVWVYICFSRSHNFIADFGWHQFKPSDPEKYKAKVDSELLNGRLAMIAVGGIATQSIITGHGFPYV